MAVTDAGAAAGSQLALIVETQQAIATAPGSFADVMAVVAERALRLSGADGAVVEVPEGTEMVYVACVGTAKGHEGVRLKRDGSFSGRCVREELTMVCIDSETDPRVDREACRRVGARSMVVVPLRGATPEGAAVLEVYSGRTHAFHEQDAHALELMAELTSATMRRSADLAAERQQVEQLRELDRLKDEVVAIVTHELRSPVTSIAGYLQLVLEQADALDPELRSFLGAIERNTARLEQLIDDLLLLVRADVGQLDLKLEQVDLGALARECVTSATPAAEQSGIALSVGAVDEVVAEADPTRIAQVLDNLLSNAIKYTPKDGTVHVAVRKVEGFAELSVSDSGIGIPADEQAHLFQRFFRASTATERGISGTGLGLTIVRTIVEAHNGTVECESESGKGTTFRVLLPAA